VRDDALAIVRGSVLAQFECSLDPLDAQFEARDRAFHAFDVIAIGILETPRGVEIVNEPPKNFPRYVEPRG
jgi:hypothetical protein